MSTPVSIADAVAQAVHARLATIAVANGYHSDIGAAAYRGRLALDDDSPATVTLIELSESALQKPGRHSADCKTTVRYSIEAQSPCDPANPNDTAHALLADLKRALFGPRDPTLGGIAIDMRYVTRLINPRDLGTHRVIASLEIDVEFYENLASP